MTVPSGLVAFGSEPDVPETVRAVSYGRQLRGSERNEPRSHLWLRALGSPSRAGSWAVQQGLVWMRAESSGGAVRYVRKAYGSGMASGATAEHAHWSAPLNPNGPNLREGSSASMAGSAQLHGWACVTGLTGSEGGWNGSVLPWSPSPDATGVHRTRSRSPHVDFL